MRHQLKLIVAPTTTLDSATAARLEARAELLRRRLERSGTERIVKTCRIVRRTHRV